MLPSLLSTTKLDSHDSGLFGQPSGATDTHGYTRRDAITDDALTKFRAAYGNTVSKLDIFHYIYGLLHVPSYRQPLRQQSLQRATAHPARR